MKKFQALVLASTLLAAFGSAQAGVVFADNFDANSVVLGGLGQAPAGWNVTSGTVDLVGAGTVTPFSFAGYPTYAIGAGHGKFIDLDGSLFNAGVLSKGLLLNAGTSYTLSFELAGKHRLLGGSSDAVSVLFGTSALSPTPVLISNTAWTSYSVSFTPSVTQSYNLSFSNSGNDNIGALLDNVTVTSAVPEPQTLALLAIGMLAMGALRRRRG
jgi:hypothetical protein